MRVIKVLIRKILDRLKQGTLSEIETLIITKQRLQWNLKDRRSLGKDQDGQIEWVCVYACVCLFVCVRVGGGGRRVAAWENRGQDANGRQESRVWEGDLPLSPLPPYTQKHGITTSALFWTLRRPDNKALSFNDLKYPDVDSFQPCLTLVHLLLFVDV